MATPTTVQTAKVQDASTQAVPRSDVIVLDIGKRKSSAVKKLRKGKGKLLNRVNKVVDQLRSAEQIKADAQVVLVVVRERDVLFD